jgi:hypothetical protein
MKKILITAALLSIFSTQFFAQMKPLSALLNKEIQTRNTPAFTFDLVQPLPEKKSVLLAIAASLVIPGMGELYAGSFESGKYHLIAESGLWLTYAGFRIHANHLEQDARTFAVQHAGADFNQKDDQYSVNIGNFNTTDEYNQTKLRNREYSLIYASEQYNWSWDSDANRSRFRDLRIRSGEVRNNSKFVIAAVVINHLVSAFSAARKTAAYNKSISAMDDIQIQTFTFNNGSQIDGVGISITKIF